MTQKLIKFDTGIKQVYKTLLYFKILEDTAFKVYKKIVMIEKVKKKKEQRKKKYL